MKFELTKDIFLKTIQSVGNVVGTRTSLPILANILIEAEDESISFTGTDLDVGIISTITQKPSIKGSITVPAKKFLDIIKELPNAPISISVKKNNMMWIECGKSLFKIVGLPKEEFPQLPEFKNKNTIPLQQKTLLDLLKLVDFSISHDETRYVLNGILCIIEPGAIKVVATDGRRLAIASAEMQVPVAQETRAIIPTKAVVELEKLLSGDGEVKIIFSENQVGFDLGATKIISRLIEGEFPNFLQVVPKEVKERLVVERSAFLAAVKRASLFSSQDSVAIKLELAKDKLTISKSTPYLGEVREELEVEYKGKEITIGFNPEYLIDVLKAVSDEKIGFEIADAEKPGVIRVGKGYTYVVLPMQII